MVLRFSFALFFIFGISFHSFAAENNNQKLVDILNSFNFDTSEEDAKSKIDSILTLIQDANDPADPNTPDRIGNTALHWAAQFGQLKAIRILLQKEAKINSQNSASHTPLHFAAERGQLEAIKLLAHSGADVNFGYFPNSFDRKLFPTPLFRAAANARLEAIALLISLGAHPDKLRIFDLTPLIAAVRSAVQQVDLNRQQEFINTFVLLVAYGADFRCESWDLEQFYANGNFGALLNTTNQADRLRVLLDYALDSKDIRLTTLILEANVFPGENVLHAAVRLRHSRALELLLNSYLSTGTLSTHIHALNHQDVSPLGLAFRMGDQASYSLLREALATVHDERRMPPRDVLRVHYSSPTRLHELVRSGGGLRAISNVIRLGADVNLRDSNGHTPLEIAVQEENADALVLLAAYGADLDALKVFVEMYRDTFDLYQDSLEEQDREELLLALLEYASKSKNALLTELILEAVSLRVESPLHAAIRSGHHEAAGILLNSGYTTGINTLDAHGRIPLRLALELGREDIATQLLNAGVRIRDDETILELIERRSINPELNMAIRRRDVLEQLSRDFYPLWINTHESPFAVRDIFLHIGVFMYLVGTRSL